MLVNDFPPLPSGGAERQAERLAMYMAKQRIAVAVLTRHARGLAWREERDGFTVYRLPQFGPGKVKTLTFTISAIFALFILRNTYDILHAHLAFAPALAGVLVGRSLKKRIIVKFGNSGAFGDVQQSQKTGRGRLRMTILRRWVDILVVLDPVMEQEVLAAGFERVLRMDNGIDSREFRPVVDGVQAKRSYHLSEKVVALYTGRFAPQKALPVLLGSMKKALKSLPNLHLLLIGQGEQEAVLRGITHELGLDANVTFVGAVNDIRPYLAAADIFVLPSLSEGISNSLLEAMSCGLACIATPVGGSSEVLGHGAYGALVPVNEEDKLAELLIRLGLDPEERLRMGQRARQQILDRYDFEIVGQKYLNLYFQLAGVL